MKFKHGDKVRIIQRKPENRTGTQNYNNPNGDVGKVCYVITGVTRFELREREDGTGNYYGLYDNSNKNCFQDDDLELVSDEFVLPEKWCIKPTETSAEVIFAYFSSINHLYEGYSTSWIISPSCYFVFPQKSIGCLGYSGKPDGYTEITYDQFKRYVLKDTVETVEKPKFEVGKWYKFIWKWDGSKWYYGQFDAYIKNSLTWSIWFRTDGSNLQKNAAFINTELGEYSELTDLSEIQKYLPDGHPDKIKPMEKNEFKKGDYIVITECNSRNTNGKLNHCYKLIDDDYRIAPVSRIPLDEPHRKKARYATPEEIAEYDRLGEPYDVTTLGITNLLDTYYKIKKGKKGANYNCFYAKGSDKREFGHSKLKSGDIFQGLKKGKHDFVESTLIYGKYQDKEQCFDENALELSTKEEYEAQFAGKPSILVFGKYPIGTIVVSLGNIDGLRKNGDLFKILPDSTNSCLYYSKRNSSSPSQWRAATEPEIEAFNNGITNIINMNKSLVGRYLKVIEDYANGTQYKKGDYIQIVLDNLEGRVTCNKNYNFGHGAYDWNKSEVELMPEGFVPPIEPKAVKESPKTEDLIDEARRRYPVGTKFYPSHVSKDHRFCVITSDCVFIENSEGIYSKVTTKSVQLMKKWVDNDEHPQYGNCTYDRYVYTKRTGKWADIVLEDKPEKWEPKVGDWVMISEEELPITSTWLGEGGRVKHQGPFLVEKIENACVRKMSGISVLLAFGRFRKAEPHEIPKTEEPISEPTTNLCGEILIPNIPKYDWVAPPTFQTGTSYQAKHNNTLNYSKPETLLTKTTLNY